MAVERVCPPIGRSQVDPEATIRGCARLAQILSCAQRRVTLALQRARWRAIARHSTACFWLATSSAHRAQSTTAESKLSVREASAQGNPSEFDREFTTRNPQPMSALPPYPHQFILQRPILTRLAVLKQLTGQRLKRPTLVSCRPHCGPLVA